jgi:hypothetical protein
MIVAGPDNVPIMYDHLQFLSEGIRINLGDCMGIDSSYSSIIYGPGHQCCP